MSVAISFQKLFYLLSYLVFSVLPPGGHSLTFDEISNIKTGYESDEKTSSSERGGAVARDLKKVQDERFERLRCGYAFSGLLHLQVALVLFDSPATEIEISVYLRSFSYLSIDMMGTLVSKQSEDETVYDELWFLYMYLSRVEHYKTMDLVAAEQVKDQGPMRIALRNTLYVHNLVIEEMKKFLKNCDPHNGFNVESPQSVFYSKYTQFDACRRTGTCDIAQIALVLDLNAKTMESNIKHNALVGDVSNTSRTMFFARNLQLKNVGIDYWRAIERICDKMNLGIVWNDVFDTFRQANESAIARASPVDRFQALRTYHDMFLDVAQLIMLRIMWRNMIYAYQGNFQRLHISTMEKNYLDFKGLLLLDAREHGTLERQLAELNYSTNRSVVYLRTVATSIIEEIKVIIARISQKLNCGGLEKFYRNPAKDNDCISLNRDLSLIWSDRLYPGEPNLYRHFLLCGNVFIRFLENMFVNSSFLAVAMFRKFSMKEANPTSS